MRILITGGSGFIGTNLVEYFSRRGDLVLNWDVRPPRNMAHQSLWHRGDLHDAAGLKHLVRDFAPEVILHMAARTDLRDHSVDDYSVNTVGVENLVSSVTGVSSLKRLIFASSRLVCRIGYMPRDDEDYCPTTAYGQSKVIGERLVRSAADRLPCPWLIVRPTSIWGPWFDIPYKTFFLSIARGKYVHPGCRHILKSFGYVGNSIYQLQRLINAPSDSVYGKTLYLADYPPIDIAVMANTIQQELHVKPIRTVPVGLLKPAAWFGDLLKAAGVQEPPLTSFRLNNLMTPMVHDLTDLQEIVGDLPVSMTEGVRITAEWLKSQGDIS